MDPARWRNEDMSELERQLLEAARSDHAPQELSARMAEALQGGGVAMAGSGAASKLSATLGAKTGLWGALSAGLIVTSGWFAMRPGPVSPRAEAESAPAVQARAEAEPSPGETVEPEPASPEAEAEPTPGETVEPESASPEAPVPAPPVLAPVAPDDRPVRSVTSGTALDQDALRAEVALLDRARQAVRQQTTARALRLLEQHGRRFAQGTLVPEATALRVEALIQQGSHAKAGAQAALFAKTYPAHPLRGHVEALVRSHTQSPH